MSRYTDPSPLALAVLAIIQPHSSQRPISHSDILAAAHTLAPPDEVHDAIEELIDAKLISSMNHTQMGITRYVYWPTGLKPLKSPTLKEIQNMSEPKNSRLLRLILLHGPISGPDLAAKARAEGSDIPAKNIHGLLAASITRGEVVAQKRQGVSWYSTAAQEGEATNYGADDDALPPADPALLAMANRALNEKNEQLAAENEKLLRLVAEKTEKIVAHENAIEDLRRTERAPGRLALLSYVNGYPSDLDYLEPYVTEQAGAELSIQRISDGYADRISVIRVIGTAVQPTPIYSAEMIPPIRTLHDQPTHEGV